MKAVISSTQNLQLQRRVHLHHFAQRVLEHNTKEQATSLRPKEDGRDGLEQLRDAPFKLHSPLVLEVPAQHAQNLPGNLKCVAQASNTGSLTRSNASAKTSTRVIAPWCFSPTRQSHLSISSSVSTQCAQLLHFGPSVASKTTRCLCCHVDTSGARNPSHEHK